MREKTFVLSAGAYTVSFLFIYVWDTLPPGTVIKTIFLGLVFLSLMTGATFAGVLNAIEWDEGLSDEEYEALYQMVMDRKYQLEEERKCEI